MEEDGPGVGHTSEVAAKEVGKTTTKSSESDMDMFKGGRSFLALVQ